MGNEKGITLVITFLMMTIMLSIVMGVSSILLRQVNLVSGAGNSITAMQAAQSGLEKTLYLAKFQAGRGGLCAICQACATSECTNCTATSSQSGCQVSYDSAFDGTTYNVRASMISGKTNITVQGFYRDAMRQIEYIK